MQLCRKHWTFSFLCTCTSICVASPISWKR